MSITLVQTGKSKNSVTFSIRGITGDRRIRLRPWGSDDGFQNLADAQEAGMVADFAGESVTNGDMTVTFATEYADEYKVWIFWVYDFSDGTATAAAGPFYTFLQISYDKAATKKKGSPIDITVADMERITLMCYAVYHAFVDDEGGYNDFDGITKDDAIYLMYLTDAVDQLFDATTALSAASLPNKSDIQDTLGTIYNDINRVDAPENKPVKAAYFNAICSAINDFNLTIEGE